MKADIQDPQLELELQELYILSTHWVAETNFFNDEIRFCKKILNKYLAPFVKVGRLNEAKHFNSIIDQTERNIPILQQHILEYLKMLEPFIKTPKMAINLSLIEDYITLEKEMKMITELVKKLRESVLAFTEDVIRKENGNILLNHN